MVSRRDNENHNIAGKAITKNRNAIVCRQWVILDFAMTKYTTRSQTRHASFLGYLSNPYIWITVLVGPRHQNPHMGADLLKMFNLLVETGIFVVKLGLSIGLRVISLSMLVSTHNT